MVLLVQGLLGLVGAPTSRLTPGRSGMTPLSINSINMSVLMRCSSATNALRCSGSAMLLKGSWCWWSWWDGGKASPCVKTDSDCLNNNGDNNKYDDNKNYNDDKNNVHLT